MQKKKITALVFALIFMLALSAQAAPRYNTTINCNPGLVFRGTTAVCSMDMEALKGSTIEATMSLYRVEGSQSYHIYTWPTQTGTTSLNFYDTYPVASGDIYLLTVNATVDGPGGHDSIYRTIRNVC